jgi:DNA-binding winged helix-turn-helix (wHTH) protein
MVRLSDPPAIIEFGSFSILPHRRQLLADGRPIRLGGRAFDLLLALLEVPGAVVSKDALLSRIWPGRIVEENRLPSEISALRKAFGVDRDQTVSGRGYQFTGEIRELGAGASTRQVSAPLAVPAPSPATNLSESVSELTGREAALSEATDLVTTDRLVTPIGEGEIGKRGLGLQVAQQVQSEFADGVRVTGHDAAERRQITAMSCEAIGPAARADGIGLQDLREAISAFQHCVSEIAGRHSGFIASRLEYRPRPFRLSRGARTRRRGGDPRGARIVRGGQDPETRRRCADAVPGRHSDGNGHRW